MSPSAVARKTHGCVPPGRDESHDAHVAGRSLCEIHIRELPQEVLEVLPVALFPAHPFPDGRKALRVYPRCDVKRVHNDPGVIRATVGRCAWSWKYVGFAI